jgi:hypothetical protein
LPDKGILYLYCPGRTVVAIISTQIKVNGMDVELTPGIYTFSWFSSESSAVIGIDQKQSQL